MRRTAWHARCSYYPHTEKVFEINIQGVEKGEIMLTLMNIDGHIPAERIDSVRRDEKPAESSVKIRRKSPHGGHARSTELFSRAVAIYGRAHSRQVVRAAGVI